MNKDRLRKQLVDDEALRLKAYRCTAGKLTIGVGRNLDDRGISPAEAMFMLENDITAVCADLDRNLPWWKNLSDARQEVLVNMCFNLGIDRLLAFKNTLGFMREGKYDLAAAGMLDSKWAGQVGDRAKRLAKMMIDG